MVTLNCKRQPDASPPPGMVNVVGVDPRENRIRGFGALFFRLHQDPKEISFSGISGDQIRDNIDEAAENEALEKWKQRLRVQPASFTVILERNPPEAASRRSCIDWICCRLFSCQRGSGVMPGYVVTKGKPHPVEPPPGLPREVREYVSVCNSPYQDL